jgi:predicted glycosyltransferase
MIWVDISTPKYAMFFSKMVPELKKRGHRVLVTTRYAPHYTEPKEILDLNDIEHEVLGEYGGDTLLDKFRSRIFRQKEFLDLFEQVGVPRMLICGAVVDSVHVAYGLGIPVVNIYDTPSVTFPGDPENPKNITQVTRLTLPYSRLFFYPYIMPKSMFENLTLDSHQIVPYDFVDVCLWMKDVKKEEKNDFRKKYDIDTSKPTIMIREEEYKAHYVKDKLPTIYASIRALKKSIDANIVIMPRYEKEYLKKDFGDIATVLEEKLKPEEFYPFIDLFVGGGGTMNLESVYYGVPTISTRSIWLYHDQYLINNNLMYWTNSEDEVVEIARKIIGNKKDNRLYFEKGECSFCKIIEKIEKEILRYA